MSKLSVANICFILGNRELIPTYVGDMLKTKPSLKTFGRREWKRGGGVHPGQIIAKR
jgi:hypothetical protein